MRDLLAGCLRGPRARARNPGRIVLSGFLYVSFIGILVCMFRDPRAKPRARPIHRWNRDPRPQAEKLSKLVSLITFSGYCICQKLIIWGSR